MLFYEMRDLTSDKINQMVGLLQAGLRKTADANRMGVISRLSTGVRKLIPVEPNPGCVKFTSSK